MTLQSPGVEIKEVDLTTVVPGVDASTGALAGLFRWGPIGQRVLIDGEINLVKRFGKPTNYNAETFFTGANFLAYTNTLEVVRAANTSGASPIVTSISVQSGNATATMSNTNNLSNGMIVAYSSNASAVRVGTSISVVNSTAISFAASSDALGTDASVTMQFISNDAVYTAMVNTAAVANLALHNISSTDDFNLKDEDGNFDADVLYLAKWPGAIGNSLRISVCSSANQFQSNTDLTSNGSFSGNVTSVVGSNSVVIQVGANASSNTFDVNTFNTFFAGLVSNLTVGDYITLGNSVVGTQTTNITSFSNTDAVTVNANNAATINASSTNTTITTTASAFSGLTNGQFIAIYSNSTVYSTVKVASVTDGNTVVLAANAGITNTAANWATISGTSANITLTTSNLFKRSQNTVSTTLSRTWEFYTSFDQAPGQSSYVLYNGNTSANDEIHVVVVDDDGKFSSAPGTILERYSALSRATDSLTNTGDTNYYKTVINSKSQYIWLVHDRDNEPSNTAVNITSSTNGVPLTQKFAYGADGLGENDIELSVITNAYDQFASKEDSDISLVMQGKARGGLYGEQLGNYLIDNIASERLDCVVFISPDKESVVNAVGQEAENCILFRNATRDTSYGFMDSGYKYMYDKYNNVYRWVPLNGDIAGLAARTDATNDPWWSFAGLNRGKIKNIVKLAWNPKQIDRDALYKNSINPVVTFKGDGTVLYGDKTLLSKPSSFDRINVRRLFLVLEKSISKAAKYSLFEFNDPFTRAQFRNLVIPFLQEVQGKRGIIDFLVRCDGTNNTAEVINNNQFVGDIFVIANRSINFIQLNFVSVNNGVTFTEAESVQF